MNTDKKSNTFHVVEHTFSFGYDDTAQLGSKQDEGDESGQQFLSQHRFSDFVALDQQFHGWHPDLPATFHEALSSLQTGSTFREAACRVPFRTPPAGSWLPTRSTFRSIFHR